MTREEAIEYFKFHRKIFCEDHLKICLKDSIAYQATLKEKEFYDMAIKALEQESILDKIYCTVYPLSIMSTPELEHKAIMQIAEMLEPLCLPESEDK